MLLVAMLAWLAMTLPVAPESDPDLPRWDLAIIEEALVWYPLFEAAAGDLYLYEPADLAHAGIRARHWQGLEGLVDQHPGSRWADDAAVAMACLRASEGDLEDAETRLRQAIQRYPDEDTMIRGWIPQAGYLVDGVWQMNVGYVARVTAADPPSVEAHPFDEGDGCISPLDREVLVYFAHLAQHPVRTRDVARLVLAGVLGAQGRTEAMLAELETLVSEAPAFAEIAALDREVAQGPDGYLLGDAPASYLAPLMRPQELAYWSLFGYYQQQDPTAAAAVGLAWVAACSPDGWRWETNQRVAGVLAQLGRWSEAAQQYHLALQGLRWYITRLATHEVRQVQEGNQTGSQVVSVRERILISSRYRAIFAALQTQMATAYAQARLQPTAITADDPAPASAALALSLAGPNPFNASTRLICMLPIAARMRLEIFDALGRFVAVPEEGYHPEGRHEFRWDGRDQSGRPLASGTYLCRLSATGRPAFCRLTILR